MAHHLAELMNLAENEKSSEKKKELQDQTVDLILKIWKHRSSLNEDAYPLTRFMKIIESLSILSPEANVWEKNKLDKYKLLASDSFSMIVNLYRTLHFIDFTSLKSCKSKQVPPSVLTEDENEIYNFLVSWAEEEMNFRSANELPSDKSDVQQISIFIGEYIDSLSEKLNLLKDELNRQ